MGRKRSVVVSPSVSPIPSPTKTSPPSSPSSSVSSSSSSSSLPSPHIATGSRIGLVASLLFLLGRVVRLNVPVVTFVFTRFPAPVVVALVVAGVSVYQLLKYAGEIARSKPIGTSQSALANLGGWFGTKSVAQAADGYTAFFDETQGGGVEKRKTQYMTMVNHFYNLVTDFYEYGWGASFHFAPRFKGESFPASIARHEYMLASVAGFTHGQRILDIGCGVGGPMRAIQRFTGAHIIGINNNAYQIARAGAKNIEAGFTARDCSFQQNDFMKLDFKDNSVDGAYQIEATCHAPDKTACFREIFRVIKPGGAFVGFEWCMTDKYDPKNETHRAIKLGIETGNGLPDLVPTSEIGEALRAAGFEVVYERDVALVDATNAIPWYEPLDSSAGIFTNFRCSKAGTFLTHWFCQVLEAVRLAPKGTVKTHTTLSDTIPPLCDGGKTGIFTPMYFYKAIKPLKPLASSSSSSRA